MNATDLMKEAVAAAAKAYCPYSKFSVGAALLVSDGAVFRGCNVENASYGLTVCAERTAVMSAVATGHREFTALAIVAGGDVPVSPCGACRQVLAEFCGPDFPVHMGRLDDPEAIKTMTLSELLPNAFGS